MCFMSIMFIIISVSLYFPKTVAKHLLAHQWSHVSWSSSWQSWCCSRVVNIALRDVHRNSVSPSLALNIHCASRKPLRHWCQDSSLLFTRTQAKAVSINLNYTNLLCAVLTRGVTHHK